MKASKRHSSISYPFLQQDDLIEMLLIFTKCILLKAIQLFPLGKFRLQSREISLLEFLSHSPHLSKLLFYSFIFFLLCQLLSRYVTIVPSMKLLQHLNSNLQLSSQTSNLCFLIFDDFLLKQVDRVAIIHLLKGVVTQFLQVKIDSGKIKSLMLITFKSILSLDLIILKRWNRRVDLMAISDTLDILALGVLEILILQHIDVILRLINEALIWPLDFSNNIRELFHRRKIVSNMSILLHKFQAI